MRVLQCSRPLIVLARSSLHFAGATAAAISIPDASILPKSWRLAGGFVEPSHSQQCMRRRTGLLTIL
jgi:hypothetical protein